ncbi:hypothetical protein [Candidatus Clostridium stratigraminis]|uniref:Uncharacterized protein n=1 Tax=Candidatus Clostridium stratigraminis TaxID=3381661 RepID=A0ABW8T337_9CLOT
MEYKVNKIDTERRKEINEAAKEGIIHGYENISIYKNKEREDSSPGKSSSQTTSNKKLLIDATKAEELEIEAYKEETEVTTTKGTLLDVKK